MRLRQIAGLGGTNAAEKTAVELANPERVLTLVVDGTALGVPEVDGEEYKEFRANVAKLALRLPDRLPEEEKLAQASRGICGCCSLGSGYLFRGSHQPIEQLRPASTKCELLAMR